MKKFRGFISIDMEVTKKMIELLDDLKSLDEKMKIVEPQNIHITIKFLGDTEENKIEEIGDCIERSVSDISPFVVKLKGVGVFPNERRINVIWIGIEDGGKIVKIFDRVENELEGIGFKKERRKFSPHVTVARVKNVRNKERLISLLKSYSNEEFGEFLVRSVRLNKSILTEKGPIYSTLKEIILEG